MTENSSRLQKKLKLAGYLLIAGLLVEATTLCWAHPTSFLFFIGLGGFLVVAGVAVYLIALVTA
jgi:hypothetical protein